MNRSYSTFDMDLFPRPPFHGITSAVGSLTDSLRCTRYVLGLPGRYGQRSLKTNSLRVPRYSQLRLPDFPVFRRRGYQLKIHDRPHPSPITHYERKHLLNHHNTTQNALSPTQKNQKIQKVHSLTISNCRLCCYPIEATMPSSYFGSRCV
jgi:hypothetical protein